MNFSMILVLGFAAFAEPAASPDDILVPPEPSMRERLVALPQDPVPDTRRQDAHYVKGNEYHLDIFVPYIQDLGGALLGIGADQNFTLAEVSGAEWLFIFDYDPIVVREMQIYLLFIRASHTPRDLIAYWGEKEKRDEARRIIEEEFGGDDDAREHLRVHKKYGKKIAKHLARCYERARAGRLAHWTASEESYGRIRALVDAGRVVVLDGDLLGGRTVTGIADLLRERSIPVQVLYLSNAEEYWSRYSEAFEESVRALPMDSKTKVLRTFHDTHLPKMQPQDFYHYNIQSGLDFQERLGITGRLRYRSMMKRVRLLESASTSILGF